jgi:hypothetical protein
MLFEKKTAASFYSSNAEVYFVNRETKQEYRRIIGGISWPTAAKAGFAVVLGEDRFLDKTLGKHHLRVLAEYEHENPTELLRRCAEFEKLYQVTVWYGDPTNQPMMDFLARSGFSVYVTQAPYLDDPRVFDFYVKLIQQRTAFSSKTLHLGEESKLRNYCEKVSPDKVDFGLLQASQEYPAVLALGFAVSAMDTWKPDSGAQAEADALLDYYYGGDF